VGIFGELGQREMVGARDVVYQRNVNKTFFGKTMDSIERGLYRLYVFKTLGMDVRDGRIL